MLESNSRKSTMLVGGLAVRPRSRAKASERLRARSSRRHERARSQSCFGWHYLSNATCLMRPRLFYARFLVSRGTIICYIIRHLLKKACVRQVVFDKWSRMTTPSGCWLDGWMAGCLTGRQSAGQQASNQAAPNGA